MNAIPQPEAQFAATMQQCNHHFCFEGSMHNGNLGYANAWLS
jgi:hypothetical protein